MISIGAGFNGGRASKAWYESVLRDLPSLQWVLIQMRATAAGPLRHWLGHHAWCVPLPTAWHRGTYPGFKLHRPWWAAPKSGPHIESCSTCSVGPAPNVNHQTRSLNSPPHLFSVQRNICTRCLKMQLSILNKWTYFFANAFIQTPPLLDFGDQHSQAHYCMFTS